MYDGAGYIYDVPLNGTKTQFMDRVNSLFAMNYITPATRAHFITFSFYSPSSDYFVTTDILIEFLASGVVNPTYMNIVPSRANIFENSRE